MGYKILGWLIWNGGRLYVRRRAPSRRTLALGFVAAAVTGLAIAGAKRDST